MAELEDKIKKSKNAVEPKEMTIMDTIKIPTKHSYSGLNRESIAPDASVVQYEPQYDPNNDFKIFGVGDPSKGGI